MNNPLFTSNPQNYTPSQHGKIVKPVSVNLNTDDKNPAAELIRRKLDAIYQDEPTVRQELSEIETLGKPLSKHQKFMSDLSTSGKPLPEIQTAWHNYYISLPDNEKHQVWQEFYNVSAQKAPPRPFSHSQSSSPSSSVTVANHQLEPTSKHPSDHRSVADVRKQVLRKISHSTNSKLQVKHHVQSLMFGLGLGVIAIIIVLFGFFNEVIIAPFIQPSRHVSSTPLIVTADSVAPTSTPEVIIPKINVEIPVDYTQTSTDEVGIETALEKGVVHYPNTVMPSQKGNAAFFGHSSNNIFNPGKYKFAFVLLHELVTGDTFYLSFKGKIYAYQVINRKIVPPSDVGVLSDTQGKTATATLITCDPPGTSINRLVVTGEQISPNPTGNTTPAVPTETAVAPTILASNGPSLWSRLWSSVF